MPKSKGARNRQKSSQAEASVESPTPVQPARPSYRSKELSPRTRTIALVFGDTLCFVIFVTIGANQHSEGVDILYNLWLAVPFVVGWFLISPLVGAFRSDVATTPRLMIFRTILSWLAAWPVAMTIRWLLVDRVKIPPITWNSFLAFALVTLFFNAGLLLLWRWPFALNNSLRKQGV